MIYIKFEISDYFFNPTKSTPKMKIFRFELNIKLDMTTYLPLPPPTPLFNTQLG